MAVTGDLTVTGELVVRRHFIHRSISRVWLGHLIRADESGVLMWMPDGGPWLELKGIDGRGLRQMPNDEMFDVPKRLHAAHWRGNALMWHPAAQPYSLWMFFDQAFEFDGYYVNLEVPGVFWRDPGLCGLDTVDWDLDVVADADRTWRYKDVEEFEGRLPYPDYWVDDEAEVRAAGAAAVKLIEAGEFPFDGTWIDFRPDPGWRLPGTTPAGWDRPRAVGRPVKRERDA
jgi:hypothetical protein